MPSPDVLDNPVVYDDSDEGRKHWRRRRAMYTLFSVVVTALVAAAVVEGLTSAPIYGVDTRTVKSQAGDLELTASYPKVTRGGLLTSLKLEVRRTGGFDSSVTIEVSSAFFDPFTTDDVNPLPSSETSAGDNLSMTFDQPIGDTLSVDFDLTARPRGAFQTASGVASVMDEQGNPAVSVHIETTVRA